MSNYNTMAKRPGGTEYELVEMVDNYYGPHRYGVRFPEGKVYKVYPEDKCEIMKSQKEELNDETKSPLDEFIEDRIKLLHIGFLGFPFSGSNIDDFLSETIRFTVKKHAEAVIPEKVEMKNISDRDVALRNGLIDEIKSASDKWRGV